MGKCPALKSASEVGKLWHGTVPLHFWSGPGAPAPQPSAPPVEDYAAAAASAAAAVAAADARIREFNRELNGWAQASSAVRDVHVPRR